MTKQLSAAHLLGRVPHRATTDGRPEPGTRVREVYDSLRRGEVLLLQKGGLLTHLRDDYGMDIRSLGYHKGYKLIGEWEGGTFVPLERIFQEDMERGI